MHGIMNAATVLSRVEGLELIQVCVGFADIIFNFAPSGRISVYADSFFQDNYDFLLKIFEGDAQESPFGKKVLKAVIDEEVLTIVFDNGLSFKIRDDSALYESARFEIGDAVSVV
jgi:hypothetical protein